MKLQLVRISHNSCNDWGTTYVFAGSDWSEAEIQRRVNAAKAEYDKYLRLARKERKRTPVYGPEYSKYPDKTVKEIQEIHAKAKADYDEWYAEYRKTEKPFMNFLKEQGFYEIYDNVDVRAEVDWGHSHGQYFDWSEFQYDGTFTPEQLARIQNAALEAAKEKAEDIRSDFF